MYRNNNFRLENIINHNTLYQSIEDCRKGKMWKDSVCGAVIYEDYVVHDIMESIYSESFRFSPFFHTTIYERGTKRDICSLRVRDRIVQKAINQNFILPAFRNSLIYDNMASLKYRGMDRALNRLTAFLEKAHRHWGNEFYVLKCDIRGYFDNIPHNYCMDLINRRTDDNRIIRLFESLFNEYKYDKIIHSGEHVDYGIGLGGEIPQSFGIITLNSIDHAMKDWFRIPYYIRYMDDFLIIHKSKDKLKMCREYIETHLPDGLSLHDRKTQLIPISEGIKFLKFHFYLENSGHVYRVPDKNGIHRELRKIKALSNLLQYGVLSFDDVKQSYMSWRGHIRRGSVYELMSHFDQIFTELVIHKLWNKYTKKSIFELFEEAVNINNKWITEGYYES